MLVPRENMIAAFPPFMKAGNVTLRPLTLGAAIRLGEIGVETNSRVPKDRIFAAAFVLAGGSPVLDAKGFRRFLKHARCGLQELSDAVESTLNVACETWIPPAGCARTVKGTPSGLGWPIEYAEWLCAEYGWSFSAALETPVVTVYALVAASRQRHGGKHGGPDYVERPIVEKMTIDMRKEKAV